MYTFQKRVTLLCRTIGTFVMLFVLLFNVKLHVLFAQTQEQEFEIEFFPITTGFEGLFGGDGGVTITSILSSLFFLLIALGAIIAVLRIVISGLTYMLSESFTSKESAKKGIQGSVLGLLLLLSVVLILNQINSNLTNMGVLERAPTAPNVEFTPQEVETSRFDFTEGSSNQVEIPKEDVGLSNTDIRVYQEECIRVGSKPSISEVGNTYILTCPL